MKQGSHGFAGRLREKLSTIQYPCAANGSGVCVCSSYCHMFRKKNLESKLNAGSAHNMASVGKSTRLSGP